MDYWDYKEHDNGSFIEAPGKCEDYIHEHAVGSLEAGVINER